MKRCEKCYRRLTEDNVSEKDPDLCRDCYRFVHRFDGIRSIAEPGRGPWS